MSGPLIGDDGLARCPWGAGDPLNMAYHDTEWGMPVRGESAWLERLTLEAFQSGLSWRTILAKREAFREVFAGFDAEVVAAYDEPRRRPADGRRRGSCATAARSTRRSTNARATLDLRDRGGLEELVLSFRPERSPAPATTHEMVATSAESIALSKALKRAGFAFVGPTTMYALMEAIGLVDDHLVGCHRRGCAVTAQ